MSAPILMVVAHPDDESLGAGAELSSWSNVRFIHVTDGAPRDLHDAQANGFTTREDYSRARQRELTAALALAGFPSPQLHNLGYVDQEAAFDLLRLTHQLEELFTEWRPAQIVTHPYEGGHPDHDATAFAVHAAVRRLRALGGPAPQVIELTSYHNRAGIMETGEFLPRANWPVCSLRLTPERREFKRRLLDCFVTQRSVLAHFALEWERFRPAPAYDFTQPPHSGTLYYELFAWGMTPTLWRSLAADTFATLGLDSLPNEQTLQPLGADGFPVDLSNWDAFLAQHPELERLAA